ncbi:MAG: hypothetical protein CMJ85_11055 [Planctomycetes bacterium]|nr:hypothetical protein [Planctomycetota bacterium]
MRTKLIACVAISGSLLLPTDLFAHGGQYRGPGDVVPPGGGGGGGQSGNPGGPTTPGPGGPTTPTPGGPTTPGPQTPTGPTGGGSRAGPTTGGPRGVQLGDDLNQWQFWWEFNKDPYLNLKARVRAGSTTTGSDDFLMGRGLKSEASDTLAPSERDLKGLVIPALKKVLDDPASNRDIVSSCMIALAKIGKDPTILALFKKHLSDSDQEQRESAALSMGIAAMQEGVDDLLDMAKDTSNGRKISGRRNGVDFRTRSFACYGLGLIAHRSRDLAIKRKIWDSMHEILSSKTRVRRDVQIAAVNTVRLLNLDATQEGGKELRDETVKFLLEFIGNDKVFEQIRAHGYQAIAKLMGRNDTKSTIKNRFLKTLKTKRQRHWIYQSAVLALGEMATPEDTAACKAIQDYLEKGKNQQAKHFCAVALGQIGGPQNKNFLRTRLIKSRTKTLEKPWLAIGLAIMDFKAREADKSREVDSTARDIYEQFRGTKSPIFAAGLAVALGIMQDKDSGDVLLDRMMKYKNQDEAGGYVAVALGLMGFQEAKEDINTLVEKASRRPTLLTQCSIALGLLGDKEIGLKLITRMKEQNTVAVFSALAQALGFIGDRRVLPGLVDQLSNKKLQPLSRAFSAVALGLVGDKEELPWNSKISVDLNYRANVETLTGNGGTGILDIL